MRYFIFHGNHYSFIAVQCVATNDYVVWRALTMRGAENNIPSEKAAAAKVTDLVRKGHCIGVLAGGGRFAADDTRVATAQT
mmetsp:Transcript_16177/g.35212  ORF Transcript_16177/g.35212 Transcript_16177/m.35212 type:complete len:81 (-) Transcript_16177:155-397(-)